MQVACLFSVEEDGRKLLNDCSIILIVLTLTILIGHAPLKGHEKSATNMIHFSVVTTKQKNILTPFHT